LTISIWATYGHNFARGSKAERASKQGLGRARRAKDGTSGHNTRSYYIDNVFVDENGTSFLNGITVARATNHQGLAVMRERKVGTEKIVFVLRNRFFVNKFTCVPRLGLGVKVIKLHGPLKIIVNRKLILYIYIYIGDDIVVWKDE
jgi:hypothetical protein